MQHSKLIFMALFLGSTALAQTWDIKGQISGWPVGKTAILKAHPGIAQTVMYLKPRALAQATIDKNGRFTLKMPLKPDIPAMYMETMRPSQNCQVKITPAEAAASPVSFLIYNQKGEVLDSIDLKVPGQKPTVVQFMYANAASSITGKCEAQGQRMVLELNYQAGWNLMVAGQQGQDLYTRTVKQSPAGMQWMPFQELWHLKNPKSR